MSENRAPFTLAADENVPVDISFVFESEKPAGKHGFLGVKEDRFVFEDGTEGRFWGTCFNSGACFPPHEWSEMTALRLAKFGVNIVRMHQMDAEWSTPNLFEFNRANPSTGTRALEPRSIERLDYLIHCLKEQGIYVFLDLLTYRQFRAEDGVERAESLSQAAKPYAYFDDRLVELQKEFNTQIWTHVNPYTGLAYKDDPAIVLSEIVNESDPFSSPVVLEPYRSRIESAFRDWAGQEGVTIDPAPVDFTKPTPVIARFFVHAMKRYYVEMIGHLRSLGVRIPVNGTNWTITLGVAAAQEAADFSDSHCYWNFPGWENQSGTSVQPMVGSMENSFQHLSLMRLAGKPFFLSEWDHAWPDPWRAESPLTHAAIAAFQGWGGATIHTYRYATWKPQECIGGGAQTINGITYRNHFDSFNDPAKFGLFYHAALMLRRGDVKRAVTQVGAECGLEAGETYLKRSHDMVGLNAMAERHGVAMVLPGMDVDVPERIPALQPVISKDDGEVLSDTGELWRSWKRRYGWIDTEMTKAAYGFLAGAGTITLKGLTLDVSTDFAVVALSSLTDRPISESGSMLLSAVGRCDNSGTQYSNENARQTSFGHAPVLIEPIKARISLRTSRTDLKVWVISDKGEAVIRLKTQYQDGLMTFQIGPQPRYNPSTMYYLIRP